MSTFEKLKQKISKIKHKELIFFVVIIVVVLVLFFTMNSNATNDETSTSVYKGLSAKEELTYRITDAVNAISGDDSSKIIVYWENEETTSEDLSFSSLFNGSENNDKAEKIVGVAVVCKNGNDAEIKVKISFMLSKVFGINADRVSVFGKK